MAQDEGVTIVVEGILEEDGSTYRPPTLEWCPLAKYRMMASQEGISWVRGRATEDDDTGRALLAAFALNREPPRPPALFDFLKKTYDAAYTQQEVPCAPRR